MPTNIKNESKRTGDNLFIVDDANVTLESVPNDGGLYYRAVRDGTQNKYAILDLARHFSGAFWKGGASYSPIHFKSRTSTLPLRIEYLGNVERQGLKSGESVQEFEAIYQDTAFLEEMQTLEWFKNNPTNGAVFYDHATNVSAYEEGTNIQEESAGLKNHYAEIKSDYNFLEKKFEEKVSFLNIEEAVIPNFYGFVLKNQDNSSWSNIISLRGKIEIPEDQSVSDSQGEESKRFKPVSSYYNSWSKNIEEYRQEEAYSDDVRRLTNIYFSKNEMEVLPDIYKYKESFPLFTTTEFTTETDTMLGNALEETNFNIKLGRFINRTSSSTKKFVESLSTVSNTGQMESTQTERKDYRIWDVSEFLEKYTEISPQEDDDFSFINERQDPKYDTYYRLMSIIMKGKIAKMSSNFTRTYSDILEGKAAYNEVIRYIVRKYDENGNKLQSFVFPNTNKTDIVKFVDTQVKYNKRYTYTIHSLNVIFGTKYRFEFDRVGRNSRGQVDSIKFRVVSEPSIKLANFKIFEKSCIVLDNPPVSPDILLVPFRAINNKIRVLVNGGAGRYSAKPVIFTKEESLKIDSYKIAQDVSEETEEIIYESDDPVGKFHLYRLDREPVDYFDFHANGKKIVLENGTTASAHDDNILPNKKYYYFVRSEDYHGNLSYPSMIYSVELVDDTGSIYPIIREYNFKTPTLKQSSTGLKRFLRIKPSAENLFINEDRMGILDSEVDGPYKGDEVYLGLRETPVWDKKFKVRVTSKSTGRKIDFNLTMKYRTKQTSE